MRFLFTLLIALVTLANASAESWSTFTYTDTYQRVCRMGDFLYLLKSGNLSQARLDELHTGPSTTPGTHALSREEGLSGNTIYDIAYSHETDRLAVVYDDGHIDVIHPDGHVWSIPDLYNAPMAGTDKSITGVREQQGLLFVSTAFGFIVVDLRQEVLLHTFYTPRKPRCSWSFGGAWFFSTHEATYRCLPSANPFLASSWKYYSGEAITDVFVLEQDGATQCWTTTRRGSMHRAGRYIAQVNEAGLTLFDTTLGGPTPSGTTPPEGQVRVSTLAHPYCDALDVCSLSDADQSLALLFQDRGAQCYTLDLSTPGSVVLRTTADGCVSITNHQLRSLYNRALSLPQGGVAFTYIPSLSGNYTTALKTPLQYTTSQPATGTWVNFDGSSQVSAVTESPYRLSGAMDFCADPLQPDRYYFSTLEDGIVCFDQQRYASRWRAENTSGGIQAFVPGSSRIGSLAMSAEGDLWCYNDGVDATLRVLRHADQQWQSFHLEGLEQTFGFAHLLHTRQEGRHQLWGYQDRTYDENRLFCYDYGASPDSLDDDRFVFVRTLQPQSDSILNEAAAHTLAPTTPHYGRGLFEGPEGAIWVLNTEGLFIIDQPDSVFTHPGEVRTLLRHVIPTSAAVDASQHVWVSTEAHGLYLFTSDGRRQLAHLTTQNSPLPTDEVLSLAYDAVSQSLAIVTSGTLLCFSYDAARFPDDASMQQPSTRAYCYPDAIRLGSPEVINLVGVADESLVTLQNSQSRPLSQVTALGGVCSFDVSALPVGLYTLIGTDADGRYGVLATFSVDEP